VKCQNFQAPQHLNQQKNRWLHTDALAQKIIILLG
jgi:hypothetical protein